MPDKKIGKELNNVLSGQFAPASANAGGITSLAAGAGTAAVESAPAAAAQNTLAEAIAQNTTQLTQVHSTIQGQLDSLVANTLAVTENTTAKSTGSMAADAAGGLAKSMLGGGLLGPIVSGLMGLFGGGSNNSQTPAPLVKFALPPKVAYEEGAQGSNSGGADHGQNGLPRSTSPSTSPQQITVNVNAMDSRSFLDHSSDIADAVRRAMLESSSLNDVIGEM